VYNIRLDKDDDDIFGFPFQAIKALQFTFVREPGRVHNVSPL